MPHLVERTGQHISVSFQKPPHLVIPGVIVFCHMGIAGLFFPLVNHIRVELVIPEFCVRKKIIRRKHVCRKILPQKMKSIHMVFQNPETQDFQNLTVIHFPGKIKLHDHFHMVRMKRPDHLLKFRGSVGAGSISGLGRIIIPLLVSPVIQFCPAHILQEPRFHHIGNVLGSLLF